MSVNWFETTIQGGLFGNWFDPDLMVSVDATEPD